MTALKNKSVSELVSGINNAQAIIDSHRAELEKRRAELEEEKRKIESVISSAHIRERVVVQGSGQVRVSNPERWALVGKLLAKYGGRIISTPAINELSSDDSQSFITYTNRVMKSWEADGLITPTKEVPSWYVHKGRKMPHFYRVSDAMMAALPGNTEYTKNIKLRGR